jgi:hypothetical protein
VDDDISGIVLPELPPLKPGEDPFEFKDEDDD